MTGLPYDPCRYMRALYNDKLYGAPSKFNFGTCEIANGTHTLPYTLHILSPTLHLLSVTFWATHRATWHDLLPPATSTSPTCLRSFSFETVCGLVHRVNLSLQFNSLASRKTCLGTHNEDINTWGMCFASCCGWRSEAKRSRLHALEQSQQGQKCAKTLTRPRNNHVLLREGAQSVDDDRRGFREKKLLRSIDGRERWKFHTEHGRGSRQLSAGGEPDPSTGAQTKTRAKVTVRPQKPTPTPATYESSVTRVPKWMMREQSCGECNGWRRTTNSRILRNSGVWSRKRCEPFGNHPEIARRAETSLSVGPAKSCDQDRAVGAEAYFFRWNHGPGSAVERHN